LQFISIMADIFQQIKQEWSRFLSSRWRVMLLLVLFVFAILALITVSKFLVFAETRLGYQLHDHILASFDAVDVSSWLFSLTYFCILLGIFGSMKSPRLFLVTLTSVGFVVIFRMLTIFLIPLEPPHGIIPLRDPFLEQTLYAQQVLTKDLFFSGHTSSIFILFLINESKWIKRVLLLGTCTVAVLLLVQKAHYTVDVIFAIPFSFLTVISARMLVQYVMQILPDGTSYTLHSDSSSR